MNPQEVKTAGSIPYGPTWIKLHPNFLETIPTNPKDLFAVAHTPQYHAGYTTACIDAKHGIATWQNDGSIWEGFDMKYGSLQNNTQ